MLNRFPARATWSDTSFAEALQKDCAAAKGRHSMDN
jgi:hypothetical protein